VGLVCLVVGGVFFVIVFLGWLYVLGGWGGVGSWFIGFGFLLVCIYWFYFVVVVVCF